MDVKSKNKFPKPYNYIAWNLKVLCLAMQKQELLYPI